MAVSLLATKLHIPPPPPKVVARPRLSNPLNEGLAAGRRLTLISAPAGYGKSTLVSEWVAGCKLPAAWLSLDPGDNEPARFLDYLIAALKTIDGRIGETAAGLLMSPQPPPAELILTSLMNEVSSLEADFILVLDDFHLIDSGAIHQAVRFLVENLPPQLHLIIATREDPDLPLARLRARGQLVELRAADLQFSATETSEFLTQAMNLNLSLEDVAALDARTEGWIAGLQLAAISMKGSADISSFIQSFTGSHHFIMDYLVEEILHQQTEHIHAFLLRTSVLDRMCGPLCDELMPGSSVTGRETLVQLERANLFIIPLDHERRWYRYHHLFRDLLRQRLLLKVPAEEVSRVHIRASGWLEANGDVGGAFHHALAAGDVDRGARLAESSWQAMDEKFQMGTWLGWVKQLPPGVIRVRPVLCIQMSLAYMDAGDQHASEASLQDAEQCLKRPKSEMIVVEKGQFQTLPARIAYARAYNAQSRHRFADAVRYAEMALDLMTDAGGFFYVQVSTLLSFVHWANGNLETAARLVGEFIEAAKQVGNLFFAVAAAYGKADIVIDQGRLRDALQTYQSALDLAAAHNAEAYTAHHHLGLALLYHEMGEGERVARHLEKGLELGRHTTIVDWAYRKSLAQAQLKESEGDLDSALDLLEEARRFYVRTPIPDLRPVEAMKARIYLKQGKLSKAQAWAHKSGLSLHDAPDYLREFERLTLARIRLAEYRDGRDEALFSDVEGLLERQLKLAEEQNRLRSRIEIIILQALAFQAKGEPSKALGSLQRALTLAEPEGFLRIFAAEGKPMVELLSKVEDTRLKPYAQRIVASREPPLTRPAAAAISQNLSEPLSDRELEVLRLIAQGLSNQEITHKLFVALSTVKGHNLRIFAKLGAKSRTEAVARARELGLL